MLVILALLVHALALGGPAARLLAGAAWVARFPETALRVWHACVLGFFASLTAVLLLAAHDLWEHAVARLFHAHEKKVHAAYAGSSPLAGITDAALLLLLVGVGALFGIGAYRFVLARRQRAEHRLVVDSLAESTPSRVRGLRVLDHATPAAFCVPGSGGRARVVLTTGALRLLTPRQLAATVEHELAHLRLRHHHAILVADTVTAAVGWTGLLRDYAPQVRRLTEMIADDRAARRHGRTNLASALLDLGAVTGPGQDAGTLPMTGPDLAERVRRLIDGAPGGIRSRVLPGLALGLGTVLLALPAAVSLAPAASIAGTAHAEKAHRD
ncbi:M56 family metallopeptidase [Streptomyces radicis]|uniref:M56 family peptidase n=1 Tax=Streptomyces radicis TaxID=1750517 RepID=A0A3A9VYF6_9ACTN|nr:M56 family metallopeptidase [Streptomyces radicis]RKN05961.1 M56 family peptidase [Streptomyces radicis]RKN17733.1 M56 family peptidase [Streptomyces radicis]